MLAWLIAATALLLAAPAFAAPNPTSEMARQVSTAQLRVAEVEAQLVEAEVQIDQLQEWVSHQGQSQADRLENLDQVNAEVARLRGAIEVMQFELAQVKQAVEEQQLGQEKRQLYDELRLSKLESFLGVTPPPAPTDADLGMGPSDGTPPADGTGEPEAPADVPADANGKLELAVEHMAAGRQGVARAILKGAIAAHVGSKEMPEIRYRLAETYFNDESWASAVSEFNKVINNHPSSEWACWSYYRQGEAFELLGKRDGAKAFYAGATEGACRGSDAAAKAREKL